MNDDAGEVDTELEFVRPAAWAQASGYADGILARGRTLFIAGQIGWNPRTHLFETADLIPQVRQTLLNVLAVLHAAGAEPRHLVRMTWFIIDRAEYLQAKHEIGQVYRELIGMHYPAMSLFIVAGLLEEGARVEIEATAVIP